MKKARYKLFAEGFTVAYWKVVKEELPTRKTSYASKYGVPVLGFDLGEFKDSGSCNPFEVSFMFKEKQFMQFCTNGKRIPVDITHWIELPNSPVIEIK